MTRSTHTFLKKAQQKTQMAAVPGVAGLAVLLSVFCLLLFVQHRVKWMTREVTKFVQVGEVVVTGVVGSVETETETEMEMDASDGMYLLHMKESRVDVPGDPAMLCRHPADIGAVTSREVFVDRWVMFVPLPRGYGDGDNQPKLPGIPLRMPASALDPSFRTVHMDHKGASTITIKAPAHAVLYNETLGCYEADSATPMTAPGCSWKVVSVSKHVQDLDHARWCLHVLPSLLSLDIMIFYVWVLMCYQLGVWLK